MKSLLRLFFAAAITLAVPLSAAEKAAGTGASFKGPLGLQLYSLRAEFSRNVPATLQKVRELGFREVELAGTYNLSPEKFKELLASNELTAVSGHFPFERYRDDLEKVVKEATTLGLKYAGCAWIPHKGPFDEQGVRDAAKVFNQAGQALAKKGIKFFYHIHGYEFQPHGDGTLFDLLLAETKPQWVTYEMDVFWVVHPGQDPVKLLQKHGKRFDLMHVKDMRKGIKGDFSGGSDVRNDVAVGTGQMDWPAILKAAKKANVKYYFIEDESPTVLEQIPQSLRYLESVKW